MVVVVVGSRETEAVLRLLTVPPRPHLCLLLLYKTTKRTMTVSQLLYLMAHHHQDQMFLLQTSFRRVTAFL